MPAERLSGLNSKTEDLFDQWFENEFKKREILSTGGEVEVLDITPIEVKYPVPVLLISGYGDGSPESRKANIREIVKEGRRVIVIKSPRGVDKKVEDEKANEIPKSILAQINAIVPILERKGVQKVSAFGESRGGIVAMVAAYLYPDKFENLVLVDPGGMTGKTNIAVLTLRFIYTAISEGRSFKKREKAGDVSRMAKEQLEWGTKNFMKWILGDIKLATTEVNDMAKIEVHELLKMIKSYGIGISIVHGVDDKVFPMKDVQTNIGGQIVETGARADIIDGFYSVRGGHGEFNTNPEKYMRVALGALLALEEKQKKQ